MQTAKLSGNFKEDAQIRKEFFDNIAIAARNN
jgi:GTP cyclohydrolase I